MNPGGPARELEPNEQPWPLKLFLILLGYSTVVVPSMFLIWHLRARFQTGWEPRTQFERLLKSFAIGCPESCLSQYEPLDKSAHRESGEGRKKNWKKDLFVFIYLFTGIQVTLVLMGFLQERIITQGYRSYSDPNLVEKFGDAQYLVLCNRILGLVACFFVLAPQWASQPIHVPPLYKHSYISFSNTMSSWCQYEALKYVSFPTQTICKASKVVATMMMGRLVRGQKYSWSDYGAGTAIGASLFLINSPSSLDGHGITATSVSGMLLMIGYLAFDAFTLNWQKKLFDTRPKISKFQMMLGVNAFSATLCIVSLLEQGTLFSSTAFIFNHEHLAVDVFLLSSSGAIGQLFIYTTVQKFGPIVFAVIMTIRQMLSILLSAVYFGHAMSAISILGFVIVFATITLQNYRLYFKK